ncbi:unnamed protein product [Rhizoctonia solani]|uniref:Uncharacterized protein n=1 Tax=Rhizoctonia solani TaxID=456999 RepID=A0A8H3BCT7_9AGAM|nr:unnamed protein product [Rhizoctonia solani]
MASRFYTRPYRPLRTYEYKDELNNWCDRVHLGYTIRYATQAVYDQDGQTTFRAVPFFPQVLNYGPHYQAHGRSHSERKAYLYHSSPEFVLVVQPRLIAYGAEESLVDPDVIGWGTSKRKAEENAAEKLLNSGRYCFY